MAALREQGFVVADPSDPGPQERYVGYASQVSPARWTLPARKLAVIEAAFHQLLEMPVVDVAVLRSVIGSITWAILLRRCLLSVWHAVYDVLLSFSDGCVIKLSPAVRAELRCVKHVLPLIWGDAH